MLKLTFWILMKATIKILTLFVLQLELAQSPTEFKGGGIWNVIVNIHGALQAIGLALLVLFFVIGVVKTCGSYADVKTQ